MFEIRKKKRKDRGKNKKNSERCNIIIALQNRKFSVHIYTNERKTVIV